MLDRNPKPTTEQIVESMDGVLCRCGTYPGILKAIQNAWIKIAPNNVVTFILGKVEMGQGTWTGLAMVMGDELDVEWKNIRVEAAPAGDPYKDPVSGLQITGGSTGIRNMIEAMSKASAAVREMLVLAAAQEWKVPVSECQTSKGTVIHSASGRKMAYGELASSAAKMDVPAEPTLKPHDRLSFVGKQMPRLDSADKINGKGVFGIDAYLACCIRHLQDPPPTARRLFHSILKGL